MLEHRAYLDGTRYYATAECFLFFAARLLRNAHDDDAAALHARLAPLLRERVLERAGWPADALALAMRVLAGAAVGLRMERDLAALLPLQCEDGGWEASPVYKYGSSGVEIGNRGLTTALALNAIATLYPRSQQQQQEKETGRGAAKTAVTKKTPLPKIQTTSAVLRHRELAPMGLPSPPPSPQLERRRRKRRERGFSASAIAKGVYEYLFPSISSPPPELQACNA